MQNKIKIVSTRILDKKDIEEAKKHNIDLLDFDSVQVTYIKNNKVLQKVEENKTHFIFTSQHALYAVKEHIDKLQVKEVYCIYGKTSLLAENMGFSILGTGKNSLELAKKIERDKQVRLCYLTTSIRRGELTDYLENIKIKVDILEVYKKKFNPLIIDFLYNAILFFSPSQFNSFIEKNILLEDVKIFCIGNITAGYIRKFCTNEIFVAKDQTKESLLELLYNYYK